MSASRALRLVAFALRAEGVQFGLIGAVGLAAHGLLRSTADIDLLAAPGALVGRVWEPLRAAGMRVELRPFGLEDPSDPLAGVVRLAPRARLPIDVVVPKGSFTLRILARANAEGTLAANLGGVLLPLARLSDILILKLYAAADADGVEDAHMVLRSSRGAEVRDEIDAELEHLPASCQAIWQVLRARHFG